VQLVARRRGAARGRLATKRPREHHYALRGDWNGLQVQQAELEAPDARVELDEPAFMSLMFHGEPARALRAKNELSVTGDESALTAFLAAVRDVRLE
jgi:hypothetical protein